MEDSFGQFPVSSSYTGHVAINVHLFFLKKTYLANQVELGEQHDLCADKYLSIWI